MQETSDPEKSLFDEAVARTDPAQREAFLREACPDIELRLRVELLLDAHDQAGSFMRATGDDFNPTSLHQVAPEDPGTVIDRYKLLEKLGEGGFGAVWAAEQRQPVKRRVALKLIKLGMDTRQVVARFEAERQALALMDHANIAKVFDAGATETGRPYFVMELVRGIPITKYCDQERLNTQSRLDLFMKVCHAIQHAHQKGIIHRDVKPSNILVTLHDGVPVPKVIDFGVAKAIQQELTEKTIYTQFQQFIGTPAYMSPEQAEMSGLDIDTRSDIYSLGVLLYELLTGATPFDAKELLRSGLDEMRKIIREREPLKPSSRLTQERETAKNHETQHSAPPSTIGALHSAVDRDLDWIVMKCLEKDRTRRYDTANGLAMDLQRHLSNEPVVARPPTAAYRFQKAWRRNKLAFSAVGAVTCALSLGVVVSTWQAVRATDAQRAQEESAEQARTDRDRALLAEGESRIQAGIAKDAWATARRNAYAAEISAAFQALAENNLGRAIDLLNRQRPTPGEEDLRGFEWRHLWQLCQSDEKVTFRDESGSSLALSPDGRWLAYAGDRIVIRELPSQAVVATIPNAAATLAFSPDGKLLASGHDSQVKLWSTDSWQEVRSLPDARYPAEFSPDGGWLVTGAVGGYQVWSTENWEPKGFCKGEPTFHWRSRAAFSPDGKLLMTAGHPGGREVAQFQVWDFPSLTVRTNFSSFPFRLESAVFAPDSKHLLIGDWYGALMVWDVAEGRVVDKRHEHTGGITAITFARDGRTFATSSGDCTVILWDAATREVLVRLRGHLEEISSVAMSPDGRMLASRSKAGTTKLWDATTQHERRMLRGGSLITGFSADSRLLVVQGEKEGYRLWRLPDGAVTTIPLVNYAFRGTDAWSDVHGLEPHAVFGRLDGVLEHWNLATMTRVASWRVHETGVITAAFSPDGQFIATRGEQGVKLWQARTHREVRRFEASGGKLGFDWNVLTFSPDGRLLAGSGGNENSRVCIWDVHEGNLLLKLEGHNDIVSSVAFSPDGKLLATASSDNKARLWDIPSGNLRATLKGHVGDVLGVAFSPDGKTLATGGDDRKVKLWNIATQQEMATLELLRGGCRSIRFSPDGRTLAVGSFLESEAYMWLWQVPSFDEIAAAEAAARAESKQR